ncbi:DUF4199 domain-containing protein [Flavobacterium jejuense]|uniref:DUF4199 domain-containing protein n=1 Tax=Flavobacterium jejuense TaxID=1544455 RepID=A0ABX0IQR0_9FLAO|nr:DUF4199 domain-containing protein [Flavobacterium jejuense]NHN24180.1 DUF4199 domain-containing protein [Flavobacterium jejuense]
MIQTFKIEIKWAILYSIAYTIWMYFESRMGWHSEKVGLEPLYNLLFLPISITLIGLAIFDKKRNHYKNEMDWKKGFVSGIIVSVLITVLNPVVLYITYNYISPGFFENAIKAAVSEGFPLERAKAQYNLNTAISNSVFDKLSFGVVISAAVSYFIRTKNN